MIGHRGWPARYPDNTLAGFVAASNVADGFELDVRRSADGKLVLSHDPHLGGHVVAATSWPILAELDLGGGHHPALLDEALALLAETPVQIEIKNYPFEHGFEPDHRLALEAAERARPGDIITSSNPKTLETVRRVFPEVRTGLIVEGSSSLEEAVDGCIQAGHSSVVAERGMVTEVVRFEIETYVWTVNEPSEAIELAQLGVSGIITDDAPAIADALRDDQ